MPIQFQSHFCTCFFLTSLTGVSSVYGPPVFQEVDLVIPPTHHPPLRSAEETTRTMVLLLLIISTILIWTYLRWKYSHLLWRVSTYLLIIPISDLSASVSPTSVCVVIFPKMLAFIVTGWRLFQQIVEHDMLSAFYSWHFQSQSNIMVDGPKKHTTIYKLKKSNTPLTISLA